MAWVAVQIVATQYALICEQPGVQTEADNVVNEKQVRNQLAYQSGDAYSTVRTYIREGYPLPVFILSKRTGSAAAAPGHNLDQESLLRLSKSVRPVRLEALTGPSPRPPGSPGPRFSSSIGRPSRAVRHQ